jgi:hypothetical protein
VTYFSAYGANRPISVEKTDPPLRDSVGGAVVDDAPAIPNSVMAAISPISSISRPASVRGRMKLKLKLKLKLPRFRRVFEGLGG